MTYPQQIAFLARTADTLARSRDGRLTALRIQVPAETNAGPVRVRLMARLKSMGHHDVMVEVCAGGPTRVLAAEFERPLSSPVESEE